MYSQGEEKTKMLNRDQRGSRARSQIHAGSAAINLTIELTRKRGNYAHGNQDTH